MNHLKEYLKNRVGFMLTYADENAKGFFKKQGFSETILIESKLWKGYIKDYDNATLRCCQLFPQVDYHDVRTMVGRQREAVYKIIAARSHHATVYHLPEGEITDPLAIPGVKEAGWDQESLTEPTKSSNGLLERLSRLLTEVWEHSDSWAFRQPVNTDTVVDYLSIIKKPMGRRGHLALTVDLSTMKNRLHSKYYTNAKMFMDDLHLIVDNAKLYNPKSSAYYKCADNIEKFFMAKSVEIMKESLLCSQTEGTILDQKSPLTHGWGRASHGRSFPWTEEAGCGGRTRARLRWFREPWRPFPKCSGSENRSSQSRPTR